MQENRKIDRSRRNAKHFHGQQQQRVHIYGVFHLSLSLIEFFLRAKPFRLRIPCSLSLSPLVSRLRHRILQMSLYTHDETGGSAAASLDAIYIVQPFRYRRAVRLLCLSPPVRDIYTYIYIGIGHGIVVYERTTPIDIFITRRSSGGEHSVFPSFFLQNIALQHVSRDYGI